MTDRIPIPLDRAGVVDRYYLEHRAKLIDIAAFLDRVERARGEGPPDFRVTAFQRALDILKDGRHERARRVLEALSDSTAEPIEKAGMKGAMGAWAGAKEGQR